MLASATGYAFGSVIYFILWITVMVWIYNSAKRKGRHPVGVSGEVVGRAALARVAALHD